MKKLKVLTLACIIAASLILSASCVYMVYAKENYIRQGEYDAGFDDGIEYTIENMQLWTVERYDPEHPEDTARPDGYDLTIYIELDGEIYEHGITQC